MKFNILQEDKIIFVIDLYKSVFFFLSLLLFILSVVVALK